MQVYGEALFAPSNGGLIFSANDGASGLEFWASDGSAAGTQRVSDIAPDTQPFLFPTYWTFAPQPISRANRATSLGPAACRWKNCQSTFQNWKTASSGPSD